MNDVVDLILYSKRAWRRRSEIVPILCTIKHTKSEHDIPGKRQPDHPVSRLFNQAERLMDYLRSQK